MSLRPTNAQWIWLAGIAAAFLLRLALIPNPGFEADVSFWKSWGLATYDKGIVEGMRATNNNYPTPFAYTLGVMVKIYSLFADPHNFNQFWQNTNLLFLTISKAFPILADFGIAAVILWIGRNANSASRRIGFPSLPFPLYSLLSLLYLFNPVSIIDGAWWGQVDSLGVFVFLCSLLSALKRRPFLAGVLFMLAMMTKLQNMIYGPLFFLFIWRLGGFDGLVKALAGATIGFLGANIEFFLQKDMGRVFASLTENFDYFPLMSLNAYNLWWIVTRGAGMQVSDKMAVVGIANAKTIGLLLFSSFYLFAVLLQVFSKRVTRAGEPHNRGPLVGGLWGWRAAGPAENSILIQTFLEGLVIVNAAFFLFQTQSHDRYAFPVSVFLLLLAPFFIKQDKKASSLWLNKSFRSFTLLYALFSLLYFYNLHTAFAVNYPQNTLPFLSSLTQPVLTMGASAGLLALFGGFLWLVRSEAPLGIYIVCAILILSGISAVNRPLLTKQPVFLSSLTPFAAKQDYGGRQTDMTVDSGFGIAKWNRLSVQYAFYRRGIGTHANSFINYDINKKFRQFAFDYGIDTEAGTKGTARFEVYGDGKLLFRSDKIGRFDLPRHAQVDVTGVKILGLVTTDAGDGITDDHTDWLNPQLWP